MKRAALLLVLVACSSSPGTTVDGGGLTRRGGPPPTAADAGGASSASDAQALPPPADAAAPGSVDAAAADAKYVSPLEVIDVEGLPVCGSIILDQPDAGGLTNSCRGTSWRGRPCMKCVSASQASPPCRVEGMQLCSTTTEIVRALCVPSCSWCEPHFGGRTCPIDGGT